MFLAEARLGAMLDHPNVVAVNDIGEDTGNYYYAMEYVRGPDLRRIMKAAVLDQGRLPIHCAVSIGIGMCAGLDHAHGLSDHQGKALDVVHRDVSLSNVLASYDGTVKVTDFGVAKSTSSANRTKTGTLKGKIPRGNADAMDFDYRQSRTAEAYYVDDNSRPAAGAHLSSTISTTASYFFAGFRIDSDRL